MGEKLPDDYYLDFTAGLEALGGVYLRERKYQEAEVQYQRELQILRRHLKPDESEIGGALVNLALVYNLMGKADEAETYYKSRIADVRAVGPVRSSFWAFTTSQDPLTTKGFRPSPATDLGKTRRRPNVARSNGLNRRRRHKSGRVDGKGPCGDARCPGFKPWHGHRLTYLVTRAALSPLNSEQSRSITSTPGTCAGPGASPNSRHC